MNKIHTIGFTKKSLEQFIGLLKNNNVTLLIDTRLNNTSQLSGFAKANDLKYILENLMGLKYKHILKFAPTREILSKYRKDKNWKKYEKKYLRLIEKRKIKELLLKLFNSKENICFLCSEAKPDFCHRRLLAEYAKKFGNCIEIIHL